MLQEIRFLTWIHLAVSFTTALCRTSPSFYRYRQQFAEWIFIPICVRNIGQNLNPFNGCLEGIGTCCKFVWFYDPEVLTFCRASLLFSWNNGRRDRQLLLLFCCGTSYYHNSVDPQALNLRFNSIRCTRGYHLHNDVRSMHCATCPFVHNVSIPSMCDPDSFIGMITRLRCQYGAVSTGVLQK